MKIKRTAAILAACMGISLLAGCGDDNQKIFEQADKDLAQGSYEYAREGYLTSVKNKVKLPLSYRGAGGLVFPALAYQGISKSEKE